ncbi:ribosome silencing factor [Cytobacillus sp. FJAT-54145]|uniref:Ribosomal silencing factor RsfS n=1 Tax=Cytobacillus spartinae TaxID=3299023 RepID=A0ABW6KK30_9BACI
MSDRQLLLTTVKAADDKRAEDIVVLNMKGISSVADYFIICHGNSDKQVQAIASEMKEKAHENGHDIKRMEGYEEGRWILVDLGDVIAHIFHREDRSYYNLERLWGDAPSEDVLSELDQ